jgi:hypothetical protein
MFFFFSRVLPQALMGTNAVDSDAYNEQLLPLLCLACPHGVFNYGAIIWCCFSRWFVGWEQYTGAANVVKYVPGLRYMVRISPPPPPTPAPPTRLVTGTVPT